MKEERYLKDREAIVRADIWKEITSSCKGLRTELGYTNVQIVEFLKEITKTFIYLGPFLINTIQIFQRKE